jgi:hypothetical protein
MLISNFNIAALPYALLLFTKSGVLDELSAGTASLLEQISETCILYVYPTGCYDVVIGLRVRMTPRYKS